MAFFVGTAQSSFANMNQVGVGTTTTSGMRAGVGTERGTLTYDTDQDKLNIFTGSKWMTVGDQTGSIVATGGTKITSGDYVYHVFTTDTPSPEKVLTVTAGEGDATVLIVGGGGGTAADNGGAGGAGGVAYGPAIPLTPGSYAVVIGSGGLYNPARDNTFNWGSLSSFTHPLGTFTGYGGQGSANADTSYDVYTPYAVNPNVPANQMGSTAGGRVTNPMTEEAPVTPVGTSGQPQQSTFSGKITNYGNSGGGATNAHYWNAGGGGGAGGAGASSTPAVPSPGRGLGGNGQAFPAFPAPVIQPGIPSPQQPAFTPAVGPTGLFGGGGGGSVENPAQSFAGGPGGGGAGSNPNAGGDATTSGKYGTGGGQGSLGGTSSNPGVAKGGNGIVLVRYSAS